MGKGPAIRSPGFGRWLTQKRGTRSHEEIAIQIRDQVKETGLKVGRSLIVKLEQGRVPSWPLIGAISRIFNERVDLTVDRLLKTIEFPAADSLLRRDLSRHTSTTASPAGDADAAQARLLEERNALRQALLDVGTVAALLAHDPIDNRRFISTPQTQTRTRRRGSHVG